MARKSNGHINYPSHPLKQLDLAQKVFEKHVADGADSPLNALDEGKWEDVGPTIAAAAALHEEANALHRAAEQKIAERNMLLRPILASTRASAAFLKALYRHNTRALGAWGYEVNSAPRKKPRTETP